MIVLSTHVDSKDLTLLTSQDSTPPPEKAAAFLKVFSIVVTALVSQPARFSLKVDRPKNKSDSKQASRLGFQEDQRQGTQRTNALVKSSTRETSHVETGPYWEDVQSPTPMAARSSLLLEKKAFVGATVGAGVGTELGASLGATVGSVLGLSLGDLLGDMEG